MERVVVAIPDAPYDVVVGDGALAEVAGAVGHRRKVAVVSQPGVADWHTPGLTAALHAAGAETDVFLIGDGEDAKTLATVDDLCSRLRPVGAAPRQTAVVAVGGGVVGDLAGFAAATYNSACHVVHGPHHAPGDGRFVRLGGKTGVNHPRGKNLIGTFHQPAGVWIDTAYSGHPPRRASSAAGLAEVVKTGSSLSDAEFFAYLEADACGGLGGETRRCSCGIVARSCSGNQGRGGGEGRARRRKPVCGRC